MAFSHRCISQKCWCRSTAVAVAVAFAVAAAVTGSTHTYVTYYVYHIRVLNAFLLILSCRNGHMHAWENAFGSQFAAKLKTTRPQNKFAKRSKESRKAQADSDQQQSVHQAMVACLPCLPCLLSFAQFMLGSKSNALRQRRSRSRAQFPYKFNAPTGKEMPEREWVCVCHVCVCVCCEWVNARQQAKHKNCIKRKENYASSPVHDKAISIYAAYPISPSQAAQGYTI